MSANTKLLPCPFCGSSAKRMSKSGDERDGYMERVTISCCGCGASIHAAGDTSKGGYADNSTVDARADAVWNLRAALQAQQGCRFPLCESAEEQQRIAAQVNAELYTEAQQCGAPDTGIVDYG